jgi:hypothetical protein
LKILRNGLQFEEFSIRSGAIEGSAWRFIFIVHPVRILEMKNRATRLTETINYLRGIDAEVGNQVAQLLQGAGEPRRNEVIDQISLSGQTPWFANGRDNNTDTQRDALRALLLCQRVYLSNLWSPAMGAMPTAPNNGLWPQVSFGHWRFKPETEIRNGIRMYTRMNHRSKEVLARAAAIRSDNADNYFTAQRSGGAPPSGNSCYDQISHWLLHAGYVSLRWIAKFRPNGFIYTAFGTGQTWISKAAAVPATPFQIEKGLIVRMYTERRPGGHFMLSAGNGFAWGYNNSPMVASAEEGAVPNGHARCLIHRQFSEYRQPADRVNDQNLGGILVLLDPDHLPNPC